MPPGEETLLRSGRLTLGSHCASFAESDGTRLRSQGNYGSGVLCDTSLRGRLALPGMDEPAERAFYEALKLFDGL